MLKIVDRQSRREFLRVGSLALGGLSLPALLSAKGQAAAAGRPVTDKSVIFLFMQGGPPQTETFDPKMSAPDGVRSSTGEIATSLPGITYGSTLTNLARLAHKTSIVRSFQPGDGNHDIKPIVARETAGANLGSLYARVAGSNHPKTGMPQNVVLFPRAVDPKTQPGVMNFGRFDAVGAIGSAYAPFIPGGEGTFQRDLQLGLDRGRFDDRRALLASLDSLRRGADRRDDWQNLDSSQQQAFDTILGGVAGAFDLSREDSRTLARYDTGPLVRVDSIDKKWNNHKNYADHGQTLGKLLLLARRLCEAGAGFVTVTTSFVWDFHADVNNAPVAEGMRYCGLPFDHAVSALIEDLEQRGLSDRIMLVCCGEMGRSPKLNAGGGRDHWGNLGPLLLYGGGLPKGHVIGHSNSDASAPAGEPVSIANLVATVLHTLIDMGQLRVMRGMPTDLQRIASSYEPIRGLL